MIPDRNASGYSGADWIYHSLATGEMSPLGIAVADLLGDVWLGIYHMNTTSLSKVDWANPYCVEVTLPRSGSLCTVDGNKLTILVVLAHDRMIRVGLEGVGPGYIRAQFHQRSSRDGRLMERYPTLEDHADLIRRHFSRPADEVTA